MKVLFKILGSIGLLCACLAIAFLGWSQHQRLLDIENKLIIVRNNSARTNQYLDELNVSNFRIGSVRIKASKTVAEESKGAIFQINTSKAGIREHFVTIGKFTKRIDSAEIVAVHPATALNGIKKLHALVSSTGSGEHSSLYLYVEPELDSEWEAEIVVSAKYHERRGQ